MKIFVCTDLHGQRSCLNWLNSHLTQNSYDAVFMLGDLCCSDDPNAVVYASQFIDLINTQFKLPLFVVHGNQESNSVKLLYIKKMVSVHLIEKRLGDYSVVGIGYGNTLPTTPAYAKDKILLTHEPPRSAVIRQMEQKGVMPNSPLVHLSGHLHSLARTFELGKTILIQVPSLMSGRAAVLELPSRQVRFILIK